MTIDSEIQKQQRLQLRNVWLQMIARCTKPSHQKYPDYGGRGIRVCDRWLHSFDDFVADMGERPPGTTIDRLTTWLPIVDLRPVGGEA